MVSEKPTGADKRAWPRSLLNLAATCLTDDGLAPMPCIIRDFCPGGMLLVFGHAAVRPNVGSMITIHTRYPDDGQGISLRLSGRVVRNSDTSAGIALVDPDQRAVKLLARSATEAITGAGRIRPVASPRLRPGNQNALIRACHDKALAAIEVLAREILNSLTLGIGGHLSQRRSSDEERALLDAQETIGKVRKEFTEHYRLSAISRVGQQLAHVLRNQGSAKDDTPAEGLSLLSEKDLEDWLFVSELSNQLESDLRLVLADFETRLSELAGVTITHQNNPFGPQLFIQSFQDAINIVHLPCLARQVCFNMLRPVLTEWIGNLHRELNELLIAEGVLPQFRSTVGSSMRRNQAHKDRERTRSPADRRQQPAAGKTTQDLFTLVRELRQLQETYGHRPADLPARQPEIPLMDSDWNGVEHVEATALPALDTNGLLAVLAQISPATPTSSQTPQASDIDAGLRSRILAALAAQGGASAEARIGSRESGIIDVADNLFGSMHGDKLLAKSVQAWIRRLEVPLLKLALIDDTVFRNRKHVAREVVNRLSRLELYDSTDLRTGNAIHQQVDRLVEAIASAESPDPELFASALRKLNTLVKVQDEAYAENLRDVLAGCESGDLDGSEPIPAAGDDAARAAADPMLAEWKQKAHRIRIGDWVLFASDPGQANRLRLAWISRRQDRFVFVNLRGLKELTLDIDTLAAQLRDGMAIVMDSADEPALDRAQYMMLQNLHHQLLYETSHDQLTGLLNRREFERHIEQALDGSRCVGISHTLCYIDIAQFNIINSTGGYEAGDRLLTEFSTLLGQIFGDGAVIARVGSDEFGILIENRAFQEADDVARQLINALPDYRFHWEDQHFNVAVGIGAVRIGAFANCSEVLHAAESSCRAARAAGLNQIEVYDPGNASVSEQSNTVRWLTTIDKALSEGKLELRCQRIMPLLDQEGEPTAHHSEILLGVIDDSGALVSPKDLILMAESHQRMPAIDRWVIENAFRYLIDHRETLDVVGGFAINISGCSLSDPSFKQFIRDQIASTGVPMNRVCFEITETAGISSLSDAADFILEIRETGCRFSLDDFGSGLSSYSYLKSLPVDYLKIDGSFVRDMDNNPADFAVVKSITEIGHFMGKQIIAECVESDTVLQLLREIGVDYGQGYMIERPRRLRELL